MALFKALGTVANIIIVGGSTAAIYNMVRIGGDAGTLVLVIGTLTFLGIQGLITPMRKAEPTGDLPNGVGFWGWLLALLFWPAFIVVLPLHIMRRNRYLKQQAAQ